MLPYAFEYVSAEEVICILKYHVSSTTNENDVYTHVCVYLCSDPLTSQAVDTAARLAREQNALFTAIYIETPYYRSRSEEELAGLHDSILYAIRAGAKVEILSGTDPLYLVSEYCQSHRVNQLVLTRPYHKTSLPFRRKPLSVELMDRLPEVHLVTIPSAHTPATPHTYAGKFSASDFMKQCVILFLCLAAATVVASVVDAMGVDETVLAPIYMLAAMVCSASSDQLIWPVISSIMAIAVFNFLFASPRLSFAYYQSDLTIVFILTFVTSFIASLLAMRLHTESLQAKHSSWRTQILLDTNHILQETKEVSEIIPAISTQIASTLRRDIVFYPVANDKFGDPLLFPVNQMKTFAPPSSETEQKALSYARQINDSTGSHTMYFPECEYLYMPVSTEQTMLGILALSAKEHSVGSYKYMILNSILQETALAVENRLKDIEIEKVKREAESNQLRSHILKGISHDLRTPLTSIIGNVSVVHEGKDYLNKEDLVAIISSIESDSQLLYSMVENLLTAARLDNNTMPIQPQLDVLSDLIEAGMKFPGFSSSDHPLDIDIDDDLLLVSVDHALISQVITNMLLNAMHHTPSGTPIHVCAFSEGGNAVIEVADEGGGIPDEEKPRIFDLFYTGSQQTDSDHYLGLGLFLCRMIIEAHHGTISVRDNTPKGSIFSFTLPLQNLPEDNGLLMQPAD